jgi:glycosyltransferase involved in cell wall biosynthesis
MGWADRIIVKSRRMERMVPAGYRARTSVIPNGVDLEGFRPMERTEARRRLGLRQDMSYVLFPGDPGDPNKGYELVSDAVDILARRGTACEVVFLKGIPHGDVPLYMNATDVMAFASHHEGSPNVIKEGLACDMPIVSVEVGDVPERLSGLRGARLVPRDPHLFAEALFDIIREGARSEGRPRVRDLSLPAVARRLIDLYEETLATGRGDRPCAAS